MPKYYYKEIEQYYKNHTTPEEREIYFKSLYTPFQMQEADFGLLTEYAISTFYATNLAYSDEDLSIDQLWQQEVKNAKATIAKEQHDAGTLIDLLVNNYPREAEQLLVSTGNEVFKNEDFIYVKGAIQGHSLYAYYHFIIDIDWSRLTLEIRGVI